MVRSCGFRFPRAGTNEVGTLKQQSHLVTPVQVLEGGFICVGREAGSLLMELCDEPLQEEGQGQWDG